MILSLNETLQILCSVRSSVYQICLRNCKIDIFPSGLWFLFQQLYKWKYWEAALMLVLWRGLGYIWFQNRNITETSNICCPRDCVSRHNGGTSGAPLKPLRVRQYFQYWNNGAFRHVETCTKQACYWLAEGKQTLLVNNKPAWYKVSTLNV